MVTRAVYRHSDSNIESDLSATLACQWVKVQEIQRTSSYNENGSESIGNRTAVFVVADATLSHTVFFFPAISLHSIILSLSPAIPITTHITRHYVQERHKTIQTQYIIRSSYSYAGESQTPCLRVTLSLKPSIRPPPTLTFRSHANAAFRVSLLHHQMSNSSLTYS